MPSRNPAVGSDNYPTFAKRTGKQPKKKYYPTRPGNPGDAGDAVRNRGTITKLIVANNKKIAAAKAKSKPKAKTKLKPKPRSQGRPVAQPNFSGGFDPLSAAIAGLGSSDPAQNALIKQLGQLISASQKQAKGTGGLSKFVAPDSIMDLYKDPTKTYMSSVDTAYSGLTNTLKKQMGGTDRALAQNLQNLDKWYGILGEQAAGSKRALSDAMVSNLSGLQGSTQGLMAALGGSADPGNAGIAATAAAAEGGLRGMGAAQDMFQSNMDRVYGQQALDQKARAQGEANTQKQALQQALAQAELEKSQFKSEYSMEQDSKEAELALALKQLQFEQRKGIDESAFNKNVGLTNMIALASQLADTSASAPVKQASAAAGLANQIILNETQRAQLQQFRDQYSRGQPDKFDQLNAGTRANLAGQLTTNLLGPKGGLVMHPNQFLSTLSNRLYNVAGYKRTPRTDQFLRSLLEPRLVNMWNRYHPKKPYKP